MQAGVQPVAWNMTYQGDADAQAAFRAKAEAENAAALKRNLEMMKGATKKPSTPSYTQSAPQPQQQQAPAPAPKPASAPAPQAAAAPKPAAAPAAAATPPSMEGMNKVVTPEPAQIDQPAAPAASMMGMTTGEPIAGLAGSQGGMLRSLGRRSPPQESAVLGGMNRRVY